MSQLKDFHGIGLGIRENKILTPNVNGSLVYQHLAKEDEWPGVEEESLMKMSFFRMNMYC